MDGARDYSDLHELIEGLEPEQAGEVRAFVRRLALPEHPREILHAEPRRRGRGSLRGQLKMAADWDSDEVNDAIARDFGTPE